MKTSTSPVNAPYIKGRLGSSMNKRPHIIEMVGVAATGKSTLRKAMMQRDDRIKFFDKTGNISYLPFLIKLVVIWLPLYLKEYRQSRWFTLQEIRNMAYLDTWISRIRRKAFFNNDIYIVEPGSVYWLSSLQGSGPEITNHPRFVRWWKDTFRKWATTLDAIIWLDAPEDVCFNRVHSRNQWHQFLSYTAESALAQIKYDRDSYHKLVPEMASQFAVKVFYFRTDQISTEKMVEQIFSDIDLWESIGQPPRDV
jgi:shikimate kinase